MWFARLMRQANHVFEHKHAGSGRLMLLLGLRNCAVEIQPGHPHSLLVVPILCTCITACLKTLCDSKGSRSFGTNMDLLMLVLQTSGKAGCFFTQNWIKQSLPDVRYSQNN